MQGGVRNDGRSLDGLNPGRKNTEKESQTKDGSKSPTLSTTSSAISGKDTISSTEDNFDSMSWDYQADAIIEKIRGRLFRFSHLRNQGQKSGGRGQNRGYFDKETDKRIDESTQSSFPSTAYGGGREVVSFVGIRLSTKLFISMR